MTDEVTSRAEVESRILQRAIVRLRMRIMGTVCAMVGGVGLFLVTAWHVLRGGDQPAPNLNLLNNYFPGYSVSWSGAFLGLAYGALAGAVLGGLVAWIYNHIAGRNRPA